MKILLSLPKKTALALIYAYQHIFSPDHSFWAKKKYPHGYCRFYPSCSEYGRLAIESRGLVKGGLRAAWRVLRCNPWSQGGVDHP
jgi:uncharacterized protein